MASSSVLMAPRDITSIILTDGTSGTALDYTLVYKLTDFSFEDVLATREVSHDRGSISHVTPGDDQPSTWSFSVRATEFTNGGADALIDFIKGAGNLAARVTIGTGSFKRNDLFLFKMVMTVEASNHGSVDHTVTFPLCAVDSYSWSEGSPGATFEVSGQCYGAIVYTGPT